MRALLILLFLLSVFGETIAQQDSSGVYLTASDFKSQHLAYAINCKTQKHKIKLKEFFSRPFIIMVHNDSSYTLPKKVIYGYRDCDGVSYRFVDEKVYTILNPEDPIVLYRYFVYIPRDPINDYFFSVGGDGEVIELTKTNLKEAFPENYRFHMLIDETFKDDLDLISYNKKSKAYRLLATYSASLK